MAVGSAATVVSLLPAFLLGPMSIQMSQDLQLDGLATGAAISAFFGTVAFTSVYLGRAVDRLGSILSLRISALGAASAALGVASFARGWVTLVSGLVLAGIASSLAQPATNRLLLPLVRGPSLGVAFGVKQAAAPAASMLAGLAVPAIALTVGWRWAYVFAGVCAMLVVIFVGPLPPDSLQRIRRTENPKLLPLPNSSTLFGLTVGFGLAFASSSIVIAFYVDAAVAAGVSMQRAAYTFAGASAIAIATRLVAGWVCDRFSLAPLRLSAALLGCGAVGIGSIAIGHPVAMMLGALLGLAGTWGLNGVFWFALVRSYPQDPGRVTGNVAPAIFGGVIGPIGFGAIAASSSYRAAWGFAGLLALLGSGVIFHGARRLTPALD